MAVLTKDRSFYKTLILLAIPIALQNFISFAVNFADNLMIGRLGEYVIGGVYMGNQIQTFLQMFSGGIEGAILILAAQYWGKRDTRSIKRIIAIGLHFSLIFGLVLVGDGIIGIVNAWMYARRAGRSGWWVLLVLNVLMILCGLIVLINPWWNEPTMLFDVIGGMLLFSSIVSIVRLFYLWPIREA